MTAYHDAPAHVVREVQTVMDVLGLAGRWKIGLALADSLDEDRDAAGDTLTAPGPAHAGVTRGRTAFNPRSLWADVTLRRDLLDDLPLRREIIVHELLHLALAEVDGVAGALSDVLAGQPGVATLVDHMLSDAVEHTVTVLAYGIAPLIAWEDHDADAPERHAAPSHRDTPDCLG